MNGMTATNSLQSSLRGNRRALIKAEGYLALLLRLLTILFVCVLVYDRQGISLFREVGQEVRTNA